MYEMFNEPTGSGPPAAVDGTKVQVVFAEPVDRTSPQNIANYAISSGIAIDAAEFRCAGAFRFYVRRSGSWANAIDARAVYRSGICGEIPRGSQDSAEAAGVPLACRIAATELIPQSV